jgi:hypothetical protein
MEILIKVNRCKPQANKASSETIPLGAPQMMTFGALFYGELRSPSVHNRKSIKNLADN